MDNHRPKQTNPNVQTSTVDNREATYQGTGDVFNAPVNNQVIHQEKSTTYTVDTEDDFLRKMVSKLVIQLLGEEKTKVVGLSTFAVGLLLSIGIITQTPDFLAVIPPRGLYLGLALTGVGAVLLAALQFKQERQCESCGTAYALEAVGKQEVTDVETLEGIQRTIKRRYECQACGELAIKENSSFITRKQPA